MPRLPKLLPLLGLLLVAAAAAEPIPGLFDTGVDGSGALLPDGAVDPHYALVVSADPAYPGPAAIAANPIAAGFWVANGPASRWIAPAPNEAYPGSPPHPDGTYVYRLLVDLTGFDPATVELHGSFAADNSAGIRLNGSATGATAGSYTPLFPFSITSGFVAGTNELDFVVTNVVSGGSNPTGLRVQGLAGSGSTAVSALEGAGRASFALSPPFPNPMRDAARVRFALPLPATVRLAVYDLRGRLVRTLLDREAPAGSIESSWDGRGADGTPVASGIYFLDLRAEGRRERQRIVLVR